MLNHVLGELKIVFIFTVYFPISTFFSLSSLLSLVDLFETFLPNHQIIATKRLVGVGVKEYNLKGDP